MKAKGVMVLGVDPALLKVQLPLYQLVLKLIVEECLLRQAPGDHTVLGLDEIALIDNLGELVVNAGAAGRGSNLAILAATQTFALLRERLSKENAEAVCALLQTLVAFRVGSPDDARWVADMVGKYEAVLWKPTLGPGTSWSADVVERHVTHPQDVLKMPLADAGWDRMTCVVASSTLGSLYVEGPFLKPLQGTPRPGAYRSARRDLTKLRLEPFTEADCQDLGIPVNDKMLAHFAKRRKSP